MDMSKAYDRIEWDFLKAVMLKMGFAERWVNLIMACVSSIHLNLCISGRTVSTISLGRGLRQGDPLSLYLFILVAEVFSCMLGKDVEGKLLKGIKLSNQGPMLSHMFFADDALLFMNASSANCLRLSQVIKMYCEASGQLANLNKSCLIFSKNTPLEVRSLVSEVLGILTAENLRRYLGIPNLWGKTRQQGLCQRTCWEGAGMEEEFVVFCWK